MGIEIREQSEADRGEVVALMDAATQELRKVYRPRNKHRLKTEAASPEGGSLVAGSREAVVGVVQYHELDEGMLIRGLAVTPGARRRGVARALLAGVERLARQRGKHWLDLETIRETGNVQIFGRLGFHLIEEAPSARFEGLSGEQVIQIRMRRIV